MYRFGQDDDEPQTCDESIEPGEGSCSVDKTDRLDHGDPRGDDDSEEQESSDDDSGVRVDDGQARRKIVVVGHECRCAKITRFIAILIEFLLDVGNLLRNFNLYKFFVGVLQGFYRLVGFFGRKPSGGGGDGGSGEDATIRTLSVGIV